jgi:hypothetical protein
MAPQKVMKAMKATTPVKKAEMAKNAMKATTPVKKAEKAMKATTSVKAMKADTAKPPVMKAEKAKIAMKATKAKAKAKSKATVEEPKTVVWKKVWQKSYDGKYRSWVLLKLEQDRGAVVEHWQGTLH